MWINNILLSQKVFEFSTFLVVSEKRDVSLLKKGMCPY